jgi:hypothetical protein
MGVEVTSEVEELSEPAEVELLLESGVSGM